MCITLAQPYLTCDPNSYIIPVSKGTPMTLVSLNAYALVLAVANADNNKANRKEYYHEIAAVIQTVQNVGKEGWKVRDSNVGSNDDDDFEAVKADDNDTLIDLILGGAEDFYFFFTKNGKEGWVRFVLGNGADCVVSDYTTSISDKVVANEWAE